ncbi:MAG: HD domain-containing protein [Firmicutes bacterium]|nr:HD domain-containing protein [Bacillota bacterium]
MQEITFDQIKRDPAIDTYIRCADASLQTMGYTEHSAAHVARVAETAKYILETMGADSRAVDLAQIAAYLHDIGNLVNRADHAQSGALMAFHILERMGMPPEDIAAVVTAIGNHDEGTAEPINAITAALIVGDKSDVRRSRVRNEDTTAFDIHDRVNFATKKSIVKINEEHTLLKLKLTVDTHYGSVMDYFEIFLDRMILCRRACQTLGLQFKLIINEQQML